MATVPQLRAEGGQRTTRVQRVICKNKRSVFSQSGEPPVKHVQKTQTERARYSAPFMQMYPVPSHLIEKLTFPSEGRVWPRLLKINHNATLNLLDQRF